MRILLVGGRQKAVYLIKCLKAKGHDITVVNDDRDFCVMVADAYEVECIHGDGSEPSILESACAGTMDMVIALCGMDSSNLIICEIAKKRFHVKETLAIVNDPKNLVVFKNLGVDQCVSITQAISDRIG